MNKTKKAIAGTLIAASMAGGVAIEDIYHKDIKIAKKMYSGKEYRQLKKDIGNKGSKNELDWNGLQIYVDVLNIEKDKCGGKIYPVNNKQDIRNQVKKFDELGCP